MDSIIREVFENFNTYQKSTIPLCAAENVISDFCKLPEWRFLNSYDIVVLGKV